MTCLNLPEFAFDEWGEVLLKPLNGARYPLAGEFELTDRCNLSCVHCFINQSAGCAQARRNELSTSQVKDILDQIAAAGCLHLLLTGGEPLLRPDFAEIFLHARRRGMIIMLFTNGTMLTPAIVDVLKEAPPHLVEVSVYGATKHTYEAVTRVPGSFEHFLRGLHLLKAGGLPFSIKSVLLTINKHELAMMQKLAEDMDLSFRYDGSIFPRLNGSDDPFQYRLSIEEMLELDRSDPERMQTAWKKLGKARQKERTLKVPCLTCSASGMCIQCPGWSQLVHGDDETIVDFVCKLTKAREKEICYNENVIEEKISYE